ncbi:MAG: AtpZ/AtpI family protein [Niabella sp.]
MWYKSKQLISFNLITIIMKVVKKNYNAWVKYSSFAMQLVIMIGAGVWGGLKLDEKLKLSPLFTISLPMLVLGITFYKLIKDTTGNNNANNKK